jgi:Zn-dependent protease with chaperone function
MIGLCLVFLSFALAWFVTRAGVAIALLHMRRFAAAPWMERARLAFPARQVVRLNTALLPVVLGGSVFLGFNADQRWDSSLWGVSCGLAALFGVLRAGNWLERKLCYKRDSPGRFPGDGIALRALLVVLFVFGPLAVTLLLLPSRWGWRAAGVLLLGVVLTTANLWGAWLILLRRLGLAIPASPRLAAVVETAARRIGFGPRATFEVASPNANALAWPYRRILIFTGPILDVLNDDELAAVTVHELGHLDEPRAVFMMRLVSSYLLVFIVAGIPIGGSFGPVFAVLPLAIVLVAIMLIKRVGRRMEERSDRLGHAHEGAAAGTYARALEKLYEANLWPVVYAEKRPSYPHLYDRLIASGVTPAYPRPAPPGKIGVAALLPTILLIAVVASGLIAKIADPP